MGTSASLLNQNKKVQITLGPVHIDTINKTGGDYRTFSAVVEYCGMTQRHGLSVDSKAEGSTLVLYDSNGPFFFDTANQSTSPSSSSPSSSASSHPSSPSSSNNSFSLRLGITATTTAMKPIHIAHGVCSDDSNIELKNMTGAIVGKSHVSIKAGAALSSSSASGSRSASPSSARASPAHLSPSAWASPTNSPSLGRLHHKNGPSPPPIVVNCGHSISVQAAVDKIPKIQLDISLGEDDAVAQHAFDRSSDADSSTSTPASTSCSPVAASTTPQGAFNFAETYDELIKLTNDQDKIHLLMKKTINAKVHIGAEELLRMLIAIEADKERCRVLKALAPRVKGKHRIERILNAAFQSPASRKLAIATLKTVLPDLSICERPFSPSHLHEHAATASSPSPPPSPLHMFLEKSSPMASPSKILVDDDRWGHFDQAPPPKPISPKVGFTPIGARALEELWDQQ